MTACVNRKHTKKVAAVVTASLVGALSLGVAPVAAVADTGIDMQLAEGTEFSNGSVALSFTGFNEATGDYDPITSTEDINGVTTVDAKKMPVIPSVTQLTIAGGVGTVQINDGNIRDYKVRLYKADENGEPTGTPLSGNKAVDAGTYVVTVSALSGSEYAGQTFKTTFNVKGVALPNVTPFEDGDTTDTTFTFTGSALEVGFKDAHGNVLDEGTDYTVSYKLGNKDVDELTGAGTYTAILTGKGKYAGSSASVPVPVGKFVINARTTVLVDHFTGQAPTSPSRVIAADGTELDASLVGLTPVTTISNASTTPYLFNITSSNSNVTVASGAQVNGYKVGTLSSFQYNGAALADSYDLDASKNEAFNTGAITARYGSNAIAAADINVTVNKTKGAAPSVDAETDLNSGVYGEYEVTVEVTVKSDTNGNVYGGSKTFTVKIWKGTIDADKSLYVYPPVDFPGQNRVAVTSYAKGYDGESLTVSSFDVVAKGVSAAEFDAELVDSEGNELDEAVNAGEYKLVVTSDWYKISGTTELPITIGKVDLSTLSVEALQKWNLVAGEEYVELNDQLVGRVDDAISSLRLSYNTGNKADDPDYNNDYKGLDWIPENVDVVVEYNDEGTWKEVGALKDAGDYRVTVSVAEDVASNYVLPEGDTSVTIEFKVAQRTVFTDVQPSAWYYNVVNDAAKLGFMNGYEGTTMFGPEDSLTRGQVVCVLFNMADAFRPGTTDNETGGAWDESTGWDTGFSDVDGTKFYGQAIYWANKTGVVNGYGDGTFKPEQTVTREEFASMLANYAKVVLGDTTVGTYDADTVLSEYPDGEGVADWAADNVAWAAGEGIMGNNGSLMPTDTMTRAYCAAMTVNYWDIFRTE
ncbi:S-layer homology domain-containing protein [Collinsella tanakaei]|nr:S-layer homology domain-containing protein [Collinsella tanakaei]